MSAQDQMRAMLDQLMGTGRDGENNKFRVKFDDPRVCKSFLLGCCPHEILSSTRMDLGECPKIHDLALKADYEIGAKKRDYYYDFDAMEHLQSFIADCDRRTELAKRRLKETQEELSEEANAKAEAIHLLGEQIGTKLASAEEVGGEGNVEESLKAMQEVEDLKKKKAQAEIEYRNSMPASSYQQQKLRVCEVCSAYLGIHDNDRRLADHFGGKLHLGFISIREKLANLQTSVQERQVVREREREERRKEREEQDKLRAQERNQERNQEREEGKERERSEGHEKRSRRRSHSRSRSRSRDRRRRRRSHSRSHDRGRRRRSRSRSKERRRRSRSRDRRSRSRSGSRRSRSKRSRSHSRTRRRRRSRSHSRSKRSRSRSESKRSHNSKSAEKEEAQASKTSPDEEKLPPAQPEENGAGKPEVAEPEAEPAAAPAEAADVAADADPSTE